ncbi:splicing factor U2AF 26 kDa subunit isoform X4 [Cherax quadricarinatus]|uniref:splicing factor U2AF 26 kDa subunit isoform X4 n=1 Tax=Cherax quadricarinatus TaxID=27406 RepID=UPI002379A697|nr:splicing factor U2AF 26 kDa subunit-like isoform X3 [Cherax quadricarinatus]
METWLNTWHRFSALKRIRSTVAFTSKSEHVVMGIAVPEFITSPLLVSVFRICFMQYSSPLPVNSTVNPCCILQTVLILNLYCNPQNSAKSADGSHSTVSDEEMQEHYDNFFEEVFVECEDRYGEIEEMNVCDNLGDHLVGNVYIKFKYEEDAEKAVVDLNNRWFGGRAINAELSPVTDFREACCRQYEMGSPARTRRRSSPARNRRSTRSRSRSKERRRDYRANSTSLERYRSHSQDKDQREGRFGRF